MRLLALALLVALSQENPPARTPFVELKPGMTWTYVNGTTEGKVKVAGKEKIGETEVFVLTTEIGGASTEKEFISIDATGIRMHRQASGDRVTDYAQPFLRLKLPPAKDETWEWKGDIGKEKAAVVFKNEGEEEVTVPAGKYKAWKITASIDIGGMKHQGANWFAPGVGVVRQQSSFESGGRKHQSLIELKSFEPGS